MKTLLNMLLRIIVKTSGALAAIFLVSLLTISCNQSGSLSGRDGGGAPHSDNPDQKPDPNKNLVEKKRPLLLQKPTLDVNEFQNVMQIGFEGADQVAYTFSYAPEKAGSLYFSSIQSKLTLEECTADVKRKVKYSIVWQEDLGTSRQFVKGFTPDITEFSFAPAKKYFLTFSLLDVRGQLADCKSGTLKFAAFLQNYNEVQSQPGTKSGTFELGF